MTKEERFEHFKGLVNDCAGKEGASSTEVDAILAQQEPKTREGRCIAACIGDATGMVKCLIFLAHANHYSIFILCAIQFKG